jgi:transposase
MVLGRRSAPPAPPPPSVADHLPVWPLQQRGEQVVEVGRPKRLAARTGANSDALDAIRAAREALSQDRPAIPRRRGEREALRVLLTTRRCATLARVAAIGQLKALIVGAPEELRAELRGRSTANQIQHCAGLRRRPARSLEHQATVRALRATAQRIQSLQTQADQLQAEFTVLVGAAAAWLLEVPGVGLLSAAQVLVSWSHAGRFRSEAAFAAMAGTNPIPATCGQVIRYRLM